MPRTGRPHLLSAHGHRARGHRARGRLLRTRQCPSWVPRTPGPVGCTAPCTTPDAGDGRPTASDASGLRSLLETFTDDHELCKGANYGECPAVRSLVAKGEWSAGHAFVYLYCDGHRGMGLFEKCMQDPLFHGEEEDIHEILSYIGFAPGVGDYADGLNAALYIVEGDVSEGLWSLAAMIPIGGSVLAKFIRRGEPWPADLPVLDRTGKIHGELPRTIPSYWTTDDLEQLASDLRASIDTRRQQMVDLGFDPGHSRRIAEEMQLLRQVEKKLSGS
jgi:hypothetical protein